jgi:chitodextrinase
MRQCTHAHALGSDAARSVPISASDDVSPHHIWWDGSGQPGQFGAATLAVTGRSHACHVMIVVDRVP